MGLFIFHRFNDASQERHVAVHIRPDPAHAETGSLIQTASGDTLTVKVPIDALAKFSDAVMRAGRQLESLYLPEEPRITKVYSSEHLSFHDFLLEHAR